MAQSVQNFATPYIVTTGTSHSYALTLGAGVNRKVVIALVTELYTVVYSNVAYNGVAATVRVNAGGTGRRITLYEVDVPDATGVGSYNVTYDTDVNLEHTGMAWQSVNSATGAPEATDSGTANNTVAIVSGAGMTVTAGSLTVAVAMSASPAITWDSYGGGIAERTENNETNYTSTSADGVQAGAGSITFSATASGAAGDKVIVALSIADGTPAAGFSDRALSRGVRRGLFRGLANAREMVRDGINGLWLPKDRRLVIPTGVALEGAH